MKKSIRKTMISLALCASAACVVSGVSFMRSKQETAYAADTPVYSDKVVTGFKIDEVSSIRNTKPSGIRFMTVLTDEAEAAIDALELTGDLRYGTLMIPADMLGSEPLTHATKNVLDSKTNSWQAPDENGDEWWTSALVGSVENNTDLPESYYNRPIVARSYVTDGNTVYYTENTATRSIGYTAKMEYLAAPDKASDLIKYIADKTKVELVFNDEGMISCANENTPEGLTLISNSLGTSTNDFAKLRIGGMLVPDLADQPVDNKNTEDESDDVRVLPTITYTSGNPDVISVNDTTLTAQKAGNAVITASVDMDGDGENDLSISKNVSTTEYKGASEYKIVVTETAMTSPDIADNDFAAGGHSSKATFEYAAAKKLQSILFEATGVELPIVTEDQLNGAKYISVGETDLATANTTISEEVKAKETASEVFVVDGNVYLRGSIANESIYYGVQYFLGDLVGYDFAMENAYTYDSDVEVVVEAAKYVPDIEYNVIQSDLRSDGVMDDYKMQSYTHDMIALGITDDEENSGYHYKGTAHNTVYVVNAGTNSVPTGKLYALAGSKTWQKWYATNSSQTTYHTIDDPHTTAADTIMAELCYTAHGDTDARDAMIDVVADEMEEELAQHTDRDRLGFSIMDHRIWCECSSCTSHGNPSDNLLEFLLDVAAEVESRLETAGDDRADTFRIASLFYHKPADAPKLTDDDISTKLSTNGKHIEIWFAESAGDYTVGIDSTASNINQGIYSNIQAFSTLAKNYNIDLFWWGYYGMATQFFVPYDSIDALRVNYGIAKELGVYSMFNQMMGSKVNFSRLKQYLMSKLAYNAEPAYNDDPSVNSEWEYWIQSYFDGAYGAGSANMKAYFDEWQAWAKKYNNADEDSNGEYSGFLNQYTLAEIQAGASGDSSIWNDISLGEYRTTHYPENTLKNWLELIDQGIAALDPNDPNYETYYWNMKLEKLTPLYLMLYVYGGNNSSNTQSNGMVTDGNFTTAGQSYVKQYGQEFLDICVELGVNNYGEGDATSRNLSAFKEAIQTILNQATATSTEITAKQTVLANEETTLENAPSVNATYTATFTSADGVVKLDSVSVSGGVATFTANLTAGKTYVVELKNGATSVKYTNVLAITGYVTTETQLEALSDNGYYVLANDINCNGGELSVSNFTGTLDGNGYTVSNFTVGANGIFGEAATVKNVIFDASKTSASTQSDLFGSAASFDNVFVDCDNANLNSAWSNGVIVNYVKASRNAYVVSGSTTATLYGNFVKENTYTVTVDGIDATYTAYSNGKLVNVKVGALLAGAKKTILCRDNANGVNYSFDVIGATKFITTAQELKELGVGGLIYNEIPVGNGAVAGQHKEGYYVLANDIDATGVDFAAGIWQVEAYFKGTFDGNGYTVSNVRVGEGGIFGSVQNAVIKNVNFVNVQFCGAGTPGMTANTAGHNSNGTGLNNTSQWGLYASILGHTAKSVEVSDVEIKVSAYTNNNWHGRTSFLFLQNDGVNYYRNITINAAGLDVSNVLGAGVDSSDTYENVTVYVGSSKLLGSSGGTDSDPAVEDGLPAAAFYEAPNGVNYVETTFRITNTETEIAAGETLTLTTNDNTATFELVDAPNGVDLVGAELSVGEDVAHNSKITVKATAGGVTATYTLTVVSTIELDDTVEVLLEDKTMAISNNVKGEVQSVTLNGTVLYDGTGDVQYAGDKGIYTLSETVLANVTAGEYDNLFIKTSTARYAVPAIIATDVITTAEELAALGVGGKKVTALDGTETVIGNGAVSGQHKDGYYILADDIDATGVDFAAGYSYVGAYFKGTFNGNGHTVSNVKVGEGGIFGSVNGGVIKNLNLVNVMVHAYGGDGFSSKTNAQVGVQYDAQGNDVSGKTAGSGLNNNLQWGFYTAILGYNGENTTVSNVNIQVSQYKNNSYPARSALLFYKQAGATTIENVTIDASGISLPSVLGTQLENDTFTDVVIKAAAYELIGCKTGESDVIDAFPAGVTYIKDVTPDYIIVDNDGSKLPVYTGDVTALGFAEGTTVYEQLQDNRTNMWNPGTNLGLTMEQQGIRLQKAADEDYASVQFSVSREFIGTYAFFAWYYQDGNRKDGSLYLQKTGAKATNATTGVSVAVCDLDGNAVTSFEVGKAYEMRWYHESATAFRVGCCEQNGEHITIYYANPSSGNDHTWERNNGALLPTYDGDVTELGFDAGTSVVEATFATDWNTAYAKKVHIGNLPSANEGYTYMDIQFAVSKNAGFTMWDGCTDGGISYILTATGCVKNEDKGYDRTVQILNKDGEAIALNEFAANTVYTLRVYLYDTAEGHYVGNWQMTSQSDVVLYLGDVTYGTVVPDVGGDDDLEDGTISENVLVDLSDNMLTIPEEIDAASVTSITVNGITVYSSSIGSIDGSVVTIGAALNAGADQEIVIKTDTTAYAGTATVATDVITTTKELRDLGVGGKVYTDRTPTYNNSVGAVANAGGNGNSGVAGNDVTGYYVLGNDLDFAGEQAVAAGYCFNMDSWFKATFDGNGYTIYNIAINEGGIFGGMRGATVKNVNFAGVVIDLSLDIYAGQYSQQAALFAHIADSSTFENIDIQISDYVQHPNTALYGATFVHTYWNVNTVKDVLIDASGVALDCVLGSDNQGKVSYENVIIKSAGYRTIGNKAGVALTSFPDGITFTYAFNAGTVNAKDQTNLSDYTGDETTLGFAEGTSVKQAAISDGWSSRIQTSAIPSGADYIEVEFSLSGNFGLCVWTVPSIGNHNVSAAGGTAVSGAPARTIQVFDLNYNTVTAFEVGKAYIMRVYTVDVNGENRITNIQISTFTTGTTIYFGNVTFGHETVLDETVVVDLSTGNFTLPEAIDGSAVTSIIVGNTTVYSKTLNGSSINDNVVTIGAMPSAGDGKFVYVMTTDGAYRFEAIVADEVITTTKELRDLGVGGKVYTDRVPTLNNSGITNGGGNANSGEAGHDKTGYYVLGNDLDFAGEEAVAAGYSFQESWFKGTFNGNGHTIANVSVNTGGIFGSLAGATIKNVNFTGVVFDMSLGLSAGEYSQQTALLAHVAKDGTKIENINVQVNDYKNPTTFIGSVLFWQCWGGVTVTDVTVDASGVQLSSVLGRASAANSATYNNVVVKAAGYDMIGQIGSTEMTEWPAGVTYVFAYKPKNKSGVLPVYDGDVTALGFAAGTTVYVSEQDARDNMWGSLNGGQTMDAQKTWIYKQPDEDYASIQFSLSREWTSTDTHLFFAWVYGDDTNQTKYTYNAAGGYLYTNGGCGYPATLDNTESYTSIYPVAYNLDGTKATSFVANTVYELRWYSLNDPVIKFGIGVCHQDSQPITVYFANPSSGTLADEVEMTGYESGVLMGYTGDVTELGFAAGTQVYDYYTPDASVYGEDATGWTKTNNRKMKLYTVDGKASFQFSLTSPFTSGSAFSMWVDGAHCGTLDAKGVCGGNSGYENFAVVYDADGNVFSGTTFEVGKVYTVVLTVPAEKTWISVGTLETTEFHIYVANVNANI